MTGKEVSASMDEVTGEKSASLREKGIVPTLELIRVGEKPADLSYERGILKKAEKCGIEVRRKVLRENVSVADIAMAVSEAGNDRTVHGVMVFRPLPEVISETDVLSLIPVYKDVDGVTKESMAGVYSGDGRSFAPCTAEAVMEILDYYGVRTAGKKAVVVGRSLVIGRPVSMLLLSGNATVTVCHSKTENLKETVREADIVVAAVGHAEFLDGSFFRSGQTVIDVGINTDSSGRLCGDVAFEEAVEAGASVTPVPGGVGSVTTSVLMKHVIESASEEIRVI